MTGIDPLKDIPGVKEFQERALVRAVRLTRENAEAIARRARKRCGFTPDGRGNASRAHLHDLGA